MKKIPIIFLALAMIAGYAAAQDEDENEDITLSAGLETGDKNDEDEGIGLSVGLEFGIENINRGNGDDIHPYLAPIIIYENSFFDDALDLYAELGYYLYFSKEENQGGDEVFPQELYFDLSLGYNLFLNDASTLSFILENEIDTLIIAPRFDDSNNMDGVLTPGVKFNQELDLGGLYAQVDLPINYVTYSKDEDAGLGFDITIGWESAFGLEISFKERNNLSPEAGYAGFDVIVSYENGSIYGEIEVNTYNEADAGITIIPEFDYSFRNFTFYMKCEFDGIGGDGDLTISPAIGVKYRF